MGSGMRIDLFAHAWVDHVIHNRYRNEKNVPEVFYEGSRVAVADIDKDSSPVIGCISSI